MKKLASVTFFEASTDICGRCGMETHESNGCCHDEVKLVKLEQDQQKAVALFYDLVTPAPVVHFSSDFLLADIISKDNRLHLNNHSPPLLSAQDTYLQNSVFRI